MNYFENIFELINFIREKCLHFIPDTYVNSSSFYIERDQNNFLTLIPTGQVLFFFRGESENHPSCFAKIYRNFSNDKYILDRLKQIEFEILLKYSPLIDGQGDFNFEIIGKNLIYQVDFLALCQHYNIATEYLDLTNDLFVALFFATHKGNSLTPIAEGEGVLYCFMDDNFENVKTIGMQLFPRPGEQKAFAFKLDSDVDFAKLDRVDKYVFKQTIEGSNYINKMFKGGASLFPKDIVKNKLVEIKGKTLFSYQALDEVHLRYFNDLTKSTLEKIYEDQLISFTLEIPTFSESEISELINYLNVFIDRLNKAYVRRILYLP